MARENQETIQGWCKRERLNGARYMFLCSDRFDYTQYSVPVKNAGEFWSKHKNYQNLDKMSSVDAVYDLSKEDGTILDSDDYPPRQNTRSFEIDVPKAQCVEGQKLTIVYHNGNFQLDA